MTTIQDANTLSKFGVFLNGENRREKFYHLTTR